MRIEFERTGGFAGLRVHSIIETEALSPEQTKELDSLVKSAGFFELPSTIGMPAGGADRFKYRITIEDDRAKHTIETGDETVPEPLRQLLQRLMALARSSNRPRL